MLYLAYRIVHIVMIQFTVMLYLARSDAISGTHMAGQGTISGDKQVVFIQHHDSGVYDKKGLTRDDGMA